MKKWNFLVAKLSFSDDHSSPQRIFKDYLCLVLFSGKQTASELNKDTVDKQASNEHAYITGKN